MSTAQALPSSSPDAEARPSARARILAAAEGCFARHGFHRATVQDVAAEAGMSAGNLYRHFASKDAIVEGLAERDLARLADDFRALEEAVAAGQDPLSAMAAMGARCLTEEPRERAVLMLEIWAEASRNPVVAAANARVEAEVGARIGAVLASTGLGGDEAGRELAVRLLMTLADGLFKRRALDPAFDGAVAAERFMGALKAVLGPPPRPGPNPAPSPPHASSILLPPSPSPAPGAAP